MTRFNPWHYLRDHHPDIAVQYVDLGGTGCIGRWTHNGIQLDRTCNQRERRVGLTHELCHVESGPMPLDARTAIFEERAIELRTAQLLITVEQLAPALIENDQRIDDNTAEALWVTLPVLKTRLERLTPEEHAYIQQRIASTH